MSIGLSLEDQIAFVVLVTHVQVRVWLLFLPARLHTNSR